MKSKKVKFLYSSIFASVATVLTVVPTVVLSSCSVEYICNNWKYF